MPSALRTFAAAVALAGLAASGRAEDGPALGLTQITADSLEWNEETAVATAVGNAVAQQGGRTLRAERFVAHAVRDADGSVNRVGRIEATGGVIYETATETARGDTGVYDIEGGLITLSGAVELQRDGNLLRGAVLTINLADGTSQVTGADGRQPRLRFGAADGAGETP